MISIRIIFIICTLFLSHTFSDNIRIKKSLPWSIFRSSSTNSGNNIIVDKILDSSNKAISVDAATAVAGGVGGATTITADAATSAISVNERVQIPYSYPVWQIHKYDGIELKRIPLTSFLQQQSSKLQPNTVITPKSNGHLSSKSQLNISEPIATGELIDLSSSAELLSLAKTLGIKDLKKLPNLDEVMNLLGTTTQAETISTIKEIATTEDGKELILQFISDYDSNNSTKKIENEKINDINGDKIKPKLNVPFIKTVDATLDRTHTNLGILNRIVTTPSPITGGFFNTITSFFKPLSPTIEIPKIVTTEKPTKAIIPSYNPYYIPQKLFFMPHFNSEQLKMYTPIGVPVNQKRPNELDHHVSENNNNNNNNNNKHHTSEIGTGYYMSQKPFLAYGPPPLPQPMSKHQFKQVLQSAAELPSMANYFNQQTAKGTQKPSTIYGLPSITDYHQDSTSFSNQKPFTLYGLPSTENHKEFSSINSEKIVEPSSTYGLPSSENHQESSSFNSQQINQPSSTYGLPSSENHQESSSFNNQKIVEQSTLYGLPSSENHQESSSFNGQQINEPSTLYGLPSSENHQESSSFNSQEINEPSPTYGLPSSENHQESSSFNSQKIQEPSTLYGLPSTENHQESSSFNSQQINEPSATYGLPAADNHQESISFNNLEPLTVYGQPLNENHAESSFNSQNINEPSSLNGLPKIENAHQESIPLNNQEPSKRYGQPQLLKDDHNESFRLSAKINEISTKMYGPPQFQPNIFYNLNNLPTTYNHLPNNFPTQLFRLHGRTNNIQMVMPRVNLAKTKIISDISQLPLSEENNNLNNKPVLSSYLTKAKPFNLDDFDTEFSGSETITERISLDNLNKSIVEIKIDGPQRVSLNEFYATGKINRANSDAMTNLIPTEKPVNENITITQSR